MINLSVKHGTTLEDARTRLEKTVDEFRSRFGAMMRTVEWSADHRTVKVLGTGFEVTVSVDAQDVHMVGDITVLGGLFGKSVTSGFKQIVQQTFHKRLP